MSATQTKPAPTTAPPTVRRYRLLAGLHVEHPPTGRKDSLGTPILDEIVYRPGDILETAEDMLQRNAPGKPAKFALADMEDSVRLSPDSRVWDSSRETIEQFVQRMKTEGMVAERPKPELTALTEKELRALAADYEIAIPKDAKTRDDILKVLQAAIGG